ncbi:unnamed protein product [Paramecium octaurelia]|uniref:Uncharacterized protein n=1 Tax=Paramecium octaurelia TaxID=43137 RepID=A0A8S1W4V0_PAROT|nr:unnamed protein product [Paramecium octaurelia]
MFDNVSLQRSEILSAFFQGLRLTQKQMIQTILTFWFVIEMSETKKNNYGIRFTERNQLKLPNLRLSKQEMFSPSDMKELYIQTFKGRLIDQLRKNFGQLTILIEEQRC